MGSFQFEFKLGRHIKDYNYGQAPLGVNRIQGSPNHADVPDYAD